MFFQTDFSCIITTFSVVDNVVTVFFHHIDDDTFEKKNLIITIGTIAT